MPTGGLPTRRYSVVVEEAYGLIDDLVRTFGANEHWIPDFDLPKDPVEAIDTEY